MAVTIYDLAREAGVSISTVSKALSGSYTISEKTRRHVLETARRLQYKPNARARSFARQKSGTVIFATELYQSISFENPHMFAILTGVTRSLEEKGYSFESAEIEMVPQNYITMTGEDDVRSMTKLLDMLEDNEDVQNVWHNWQQD